MTNLFFTLSFTFGALSEFQYNYVDLVCSSVDRKPIHNAKEIMFCESNSTLTTNFNTKINFVDYDYKFGSDFQYIRGLTLKKMQNLTLLPYGITKYWNLSVFEISDSGLMHIDQHDMQQFGSHIEHVSFCRTQLSVLEDDLFQFNPNLFYVSFEGNPLTFIAYVFRDNLSRMKNLYEVNMYHCNCLSDIRFKGFFNYILYGPYCNDIVSFQKHFKIANKRKLIISNQMRNDLEKLMDQFVEMTYRISKIEKTINKRGFKFQDLKLEYNKTQEHIHDHHVELKKTYDSKIDKTEFTTMFLELQNELKDLKSKEKILESEKISMLIICHILVAIIITSVTLFIYIILSLRKIKNIKTTTKNNTIHELKIVTNHHESHHLEETDDLGLYDTIGKCTSGQPTRSSIESNHSNHLNSNLNELYDAVDESKNHLDELYAVVDKSKNT